VTLGLGAVPVAVLAVAAWSQRWVSDDGFINLRVVDQLLAGNGPVFNVGERVEAFTSPLWVALLTAAGAVTPFQLSWVAVGLGIGSAVAGLALAEAAGVTALGRRRGALAVPVGGLVVAATPPFWDFASSGLETGLGFAWLGACSFVLARRWREQAWARPPDRPRWQGALIGVGVLVRPDFAVFAAAFGVALVALSRPRRVPAVARAVGWVAALPVAYELFRAGYYASLVPNTAHAKEAFGPADWSGGLAYLVDLAGPYWLVVPVAVLAAVLVARVGSAVRRRDPRWVWLAAPAVAALVHAVFVMRLGGGFMHGRLLLPALFALAAPVAVAVPTRLRGKAAPEARWSPGMPPAAVGACVVVVAWAAAVVGVVGGIPEVNPFAADGVADERAFYAEQAGGVAHPVTLADYRAHPWVEVGRMVGGYAQRSEPALFGDEVGDGAWDRQLPQLVGPDARVTPVPGGTPTVAAFPAVGLFSYAAGRGAHVVDQLGLASPLASRLLLTQRGRPGHSKRLDPVWVVARFAGPPTAGREPAAQVADARRALACPPLARLQRAITAPLGPGQFLANIATAVELYSLRIPAEPGRAAERLC
jgi:arabinofuranosyltransferase